MDANGRKMRDSSMWGLDWMVGWWLGLVVVLDNSHGLVALPAAMKQMI